MKSRILSAMLAFTLAGGGAAWAALKLGAAAPDFSAPATLGDSVFSFSLKDSLKKGPVVLYFYPAAFTPGCTAEAHDFADAVPKFAALGASVIGVSEDSIDVLKKFATSECRKKFPVASDGDGSITAAYDAVLLMRITHHSNRTSYAIAPDGKVIAVWSAMDSEQHVGKMLDAVTAWRAAQPAK